MHEREVVVVLEDFEQRVEAVSTRRMHLVPGSGLVEVMDNRALTGMDPGFSTTKLTPSFPGSRPS